MRLDRLNNMENYILQRGTASLEDIAQNFGISINTVRRDIAELFDRGNIKKVYGGVSTCFSAAQSPVSANERALRNIEAKQKIGLLASSLVEDKETIFLDSGSTTVQILQHLAQRSGVTVVTHSLSAMYEAAKHPNLRVIALGGIYSPSTSSYFSAATLGTISRMKFDTVFIAATGVSLSQGLSNTTYFEVEIKRAAAASKRVVLMADQSKFGFEAPFSFMAFERLSAVVTDREPAPEYMDCMEKNSITLLCRN